MSTEHLLIENRNDFTLSVIESSCEFTLELANAAAPDSRMLTICKLSAEDLVKLAQNLIQIASYNVKDGDKLLERFNVNYGLDSLVVR